MRISRNAKEGCSVRGSCVNAPTALGSQGSQQKTNELRSVSARGLSSASRPLELTLASSEVLTAIGAHRHAAHSPHTLDMYHLSILVTGRGAAQGRTFACCCPCDSFSPGTYVSSRHLKYHQIGVSILPLIWAYASETDLCLATDRHPFQVVPCLALCSLWPGSWLKAILLQEKWSWKSNGWLYMCAVWWFNVTWKIASQATRGLLKASEGIALSCTNSRAWHTEAADGEVIKWARLLVTMLKVLVPQWELVLYLWERKYPEQNVTFSANEVGQIVFISL